MKLFFENWNKFLNEENKNNLDNWEHEDAKSYAEELIEQYGKPDVSTDKMVLWKDNKISEFKKVYVLDESIEHCCPKPHRDFVYSTMEIDVPEELMEAVAKASESIIVDQLKNEVTARCADIIANAITLGFVQKLVEGEIKPEDAEKEYERHILESITPEWFKEELDEGKICPKGKAWAMRKYGKWSAYAAMGASKYCKDPNYGKGKKKDEEVKDTYGDEIVKRNKRDREEGAKELIKQEGELKKWREENWVQSDGTPCGDAKAQKNPKRCKPKAKWATMSKGEKAADNRKKKKGGKKGKQFVSATKKGKVTKGYTKESLIMKITESRLKEILKEELENILNETEEYYHITDATYDDGNIVEELDFWDDILEEAEYQGRKVTLNKPMKGDVKKSKVYVKDPKTGNVKKVNFGDPNMKIRKSNPKARKSFRARHNCDNPGPKTKARYWSCKAW